MTRRERVWETGNTCRDGGHDFTELELVQDGGLARRIKPYH